MSRSRILLLLVCFSTLNVVAQSVSGTISGFVKDPQGATIPSATVVARSPQTGTVVSAVSGDDGYYRLQNLIPGEHIIEITTPGFRTFTTPGVRISTSSSQLARVSEPIRRDATLEVCTVSENITVEAITTRVNTEDNQLGETIREISRLPLLSGEVGRSPLDLLALSA